jgi:SAM-dependent methyltransferase
VSAEHWQSAYETADQHSWDQQTPAVDLEMLVDAGMRPADAVVDVGGGDGAFTRALQERGHGDLTVLDIAEQALTAGRARLGDRHGEVTWIAADVRGWVPPRRWDVWHDRAVFHFLITDADRAGYRRALAAATGPGSLVCVGTFAEDGPTQCSGLPVARYDVTSLAEELRADGLVDLELVGTRRETHLTPRGTPQPFSWALMRRGTSL